MITRSLKRIDEKVGVLLQSILRVMLGTIFYGLALNVLAYWVITSLWEGGAWYAELWFYERHAAEFLLKTTGLACMGSGALMYLLVPVRNFAVFLAPWLLLIAGVGALIITA